MKSSEETLEELRDAIHRMGETVNLSHELYARIQNAIRDLKQGSQAMTKEQQEKLEAICKEALTHKDAIEALYRAGYFDGAKVATERTH